MKRRLSRRANKRVWNKGTRVKRKNFATRGGIRA